MLISTFITLIGALAAMVAIGAALSRKVRFDGEVKQALVTIILYVAMPCMIVNGLLQLPVDEALGKQMLLVLVISVAVNSLGILLGFLSSWPLGITVRKRKELAVLAGLGNTGFLGIPLCAVLFGPKGALLAAVFDTGLDLVIWTYVLLLLQEKKEWSWRGLRELASPPMLAVFAGLLAAALQLQPPALVALLLQMLGQVTVPLAMLYIGLLLAELASRRPNLHVKQLTVPITVKLVLLPVAVFLLLQLLGVEKELNQVVLVQAAMPTLTIASVLFARCSADTELAAVTSVLSTVLSAVTIPAMILMLGY